MNVQFNKAFDFLMQVLIFQLLFLLLFYCQCVRGTYAVWYTGMHGYTTFSTCYAPCNMNMTYKVICVILHAVSELIHGVTACGVSVLRV